MHNAERTPTPERLLTGSGRPGGWLSLSGSCVLLLALFMPVSDCGVSCQHQREVVYGYQYALSGSWSAPYVSALVAALLAERWLFGSTLVATAAALAWLAALVAWTLFGLFAIAEPSNLQHGLYLGSFLFWMALWSVLAASITQRRWPMRWSARVTWSGGAMSAIFFGYIIAAQKVKVYIGCWVSLVSSLVLFLGGVLVERRARVGARSDGAPHQDALRGQDKG